MERKIHRMIHSGTEAKSFIEAFPLGNGRLGAMIYGGVHEDRISLNEGTLWSGSPLEPTEKDSSQTLRDIRKLIFENQYRKAQDIVERELIGNFQDSFLPLATLNLNFKGLPEYNNYKRSLDLSTATVHVSFEAQQRTYHREYFCSHPDRVFVTQLWTDDEEPWSCSLALTSKLRHQTEAGQRHMEIRGYCPSSVLWEKGSEGQCYYDGSKLSDELSGAPVGEALTNCIDHNFKTLSFSGVLKIRGEHCEIRREGQALKICSRGPVTLLFYALTNFESYKKIKKVGVHQLSELCHHGLNGLETKTYEELKSLHVHDYQNLYFKTSLSLVTDPPNLRLDELIANTNSTGDTRQMAETLFNYGRYLLISSSRSGGQATNLQGIWNESPHPIWSSGYTTNINLQMSYWMVNTCRLQDCFEPFITLVSELSVQGKTTARQYHHTDGWCSHHNTDLWRQSHPVGDNAKWAFWPMGGVWLCKSLWDHYRYTADRDFLERQAYPIFEGATEFLLNWLMILPDGTLGTPLGTSPENEFIDPSTKKATSISHSPTLDLTLAREHLSTFIQCSKILNKKNLVEDCLESLEKIPGYKINARGVLQEWALDFEEADPMHRHMSHLYGLYPGSDIQPDSEVGEAAKKVLLKKGLISTGWSIIWKSCLWSQFGDGQRALQCLKNIFLPCSVDIWKSDEDIGGVYPNLFMACPPFCIDSNFGIVAAISEMLVQCRNGEVLLLPALPHEWSSGSFRGIGIPQQCTLDMAWHDGALTELSLEPNLDQDLVLVSPTELVNFMGEGLESKGRYTYLLPLKKGRHYCWKRGGKL